MHIRFFVEVKVEEKREKWLKVVSKDLVIVYHPNWKQKAEYTLN